MYIQKKPEKTKIYIGSMYNRQNLLIRVIEVQNITLNHTGKGISQQRVFDEIIKPRFMISQRTFYNYLSMNAKRELRYLMEQNKRT